MIQTEMAAVKAQAAPEDLPPKIRPTQLLDSIKKALFVIGSALLIFAAARNSVTWQLQRVWGASGSFWQRQWDNTYELFGRNDLFIGFIGTFIITSCTYWLANSFLMFLDLTGKPEFLLRYKIQPTKNNPLTKEDLMKAVKLVSFNQICVSVPFLYAVHHASLWRGCGIGGDLPTFPWVLFELLIFTLVEEVGFYYSHRLMHHPRLYKHIHKIHHEWISPIGLIGIYAHPIEHLVSNSIPPAIGPLLMGSHLSTAWMWYCLAILSTTVSHCGYHFPLLPSPEAHDFHHLKFNQNYGVLGVLDRLHGTDATFRASKAYQRHVLLLSTVPVSQQFPDDPKDKQKSE